MSPCSERCLRLEQVRSGPAQLADRLQNKTQRLEHESDVNALLLVGTAVQSFGKLCQSESRRTSLTADTQSYTVDESCVWHKRLQLGSSEHINERLCSAECSHKQYRQTGNRFVSRSYRVVLRVCS